ncbi:MAG: hypothetical protein IAI49_17115 [Candidatus Eremiobacteraeota bacterium]|nr:hypothetical protein [Candidatus Eremiobacteraeota bacterium]
MKPSETADAAEALLAQSFDAAKSNDDSPLAKLAQDAGFVRQLQSLIAVARGEGDAARTAANKIVNLISATPAAREWIQQYVNRIGREPPVTRSFAAPTTEPIDPISATLFNCPHKDWPWYRPTIGTPIPKCPHHDLLLVRS